MLKPLPLTVTFVTLIEAVELELLLRTMELLLLVPREMLPKFTEVTLKFKLGGSPPGFEDCGPVEVPAHPKKAETTPKIDNLTT